MYLSPLDFWRHHPTGRPDGPGGPPPLPFSTRSFYEPDPVPWRSTWAASLVEAAALIVAAGAMTNKESGRQIAQLSGRSIEDDIDFICGTRWPGSGPGPRPNVTQVASDLALTASGLGEGALRSELLRIAGQLLDKAAQGATGGLRAVS
jgi:hypothetical protein